MLTKEELIEILQSVGAPLNEGISSESNTGQFPRIVFWEFLWEPKMASGREYNTVVTYQISIYAKRPRAQVVVDVKKALAEHGLYPMINHEFMEEERYFHSYLAVDVMEDIL